MNTGIHDAQRLKELQALPLERKVGFSIARIVEWYSRNKGKVYVAFSGGKDSTVLLYLVRQLYPDVPAVFCDTGLEYPEIRDFVRKFDNVIFLKPKKTFHEMVKQFGYPVISKEISDSVAMARSKPGGYYAQKFDPESKVSKAYGGRFNFSRYKHLLDAPFKMSAYCCRVMKKNPSKVYEKQTGRVPYIGMLATEGRQRRMQWIKNGCNAFGKSRPTSNPLSFWTDQDILRYAQIKKIDLAPVYGDIVADEKGKLSCSKLQRTGCVFCLFGILKDGEPNRMQKLKETHPRLYKYCIGGGCCVNGNYEPDKKGLGMGRVLDWLGIPY